MTMTQGKTGSLPGSVSDGALSDLGCAQADRLSVGGVPARELVERFGSPLYVFDAGVLRRQVCAVRDALGPRVDVLFALKSNPNAAVAQVMRLAGAGAEIASAGEICVARHAGFQGAAMQFAGPGKDREDLLLAFEVGLGSLNVESLAEYEALGALARERGHRPAIAIRVNPREQVSGSRMRMGGGSKKFGVDADDVAALVRRIVADDLVELRGLHVYAGTQCFEAASWVANARALVRFAHEIEAETGVELTTLNLGGGFGVACFEGDPTFDLAAAGRGLQEVIAEDARPSRRYFVELGRYLTARAGVYLTRVTYLKQSGDKTHVILDGGLHQHSAAAGVGAVIRRPFPIVHADALHREADGKYTLGGPLCTPADEFCASAALPAVAAGDVLAILSSGAYGLTFSNTMFLSHPQPAEVLVDDGRAHIVREAGKPEDALRGQLLPK
jgi:diaminopimelate decarboxylase